MWVEALSEDPFLKGDGDLRAKHTTRSPVVQKITHCVMLFELGNLEFVFASLYCQISLPLGLVVSQPLREIGTEPSFVLNVNAPACKCCIGS